MSRSRRLPFVAALLAATLLAMAWWGWQTLDAAQLLLGSRLC